MLKYHERIQIRRPTLAHRERNPRNARKRLKTKGECNGSEEEVKVKTQLQQEGQPGSANRDAPQEIWQAQDQEPQAGDRYRALEGAQKGRKSSKEEIRGKENGYQITFIAKQVVSQQEAFVVIEQQKPEVFRPELRQEGAEQD